MKRRSLIDIAFNSWINNRPLSFHPCDMKRFYIFIKTVLRDGRNIKKRNYQWFDKLIKDSKVSMTDEDIEKFFDQFVTLRDFDSETPLRREYDGKDSEGNDIYKIR